MKTLLRSLACVAAAGASILPLRAAEPATAPLPPVETVSSGYVPCKITSKTTAVFPVRLLTNGVTHGEVQLVLEVSTDGQLTDTLVAAYTHHEFAEEALRVINASRFTPGLVDGQPVISIVNYVFKFETSGVLAYQRIGMASRSEPKFGNEFEYRPHGVTTLDGPPSPRVHPAPIYPKKWSDEGRSGSVTVDFYIDEDGRPRVPLAVDAPDEYLASAAVAALKDWRFETPRHLGRPALAHAQQVFVFKLEPKTTPDA